MFYSSLSPYLNDVGYSRAILCYIGQNYDFSLDWANKISLFFALINEKLLLGDLWECEFSQEGFLVGCNGLDLGGNIFLFVAVITNFVVFFSWLKRRE